MSDCFTNPSMQCHSPYTLGQYKEDFTRETEIVSTGNGYEKRISTTPPGNRQILPLYLPACSYNNQSRRNFADFNTELLIAREAERMDVLRHSARRLRLPRRYHKAYNGFRPCK